jgi:hypothetical protein
MIIAAVAFGAFLLGILMIHSGAKLVKFSLKPLILLVCCFGASNWFWSTMPQPTATVVDSRTIEFDYFPKRLHSTVKTNFKDNNGKFHIEFEELPLDGLFIVHGEEKHYFYQITYNNNAIASIEELNEPVGWMIKHYK